MVKEKPNKHNNLYISAIMQVESIPEFLFVKMKLLFLHWEGQQLRRGIRFTIQVNCVLKLRRTATSDVHCKLFRGPTLI